MPLAKLDTVPYIALRIKSENRRDGGGQSRPGNLRHHLHQHQHGTDETTTSHKFGTLLCFMLTGRQRSRPE